LTSEPARAGVQSIATPVSWLQEKNIKHNGNLTLEDVYEVARVMRDRSCAATFSGTVKEMLGTCVSGEGSNFGCKVPLQVDFVYEFGVPKVHRQGDAGHLRVR